MRKEISPIEKERDLGESLLKQYFREEAMEEQFGLKEIEVDPEVISSIISPNGRRTDKSRLAEITDPKVKLMLRIRTRKLELLNKLQFTDPGLAEARRHERKKTRFTAREKMYKDKIVNGENVETSLIDVQKTLEKLNHREGQQPLKDNIARLIKIKAQITEEQNKRTSVSTRKK
jgi:hypothetical protein